MTLCVVLEFLIIIKLSHFKIHYLRAAAESERQKAEAAKALKADIEQQLVEKEREKEYAYQQFIKEKLMIDEVVRKIYEEDAKVRQIEMEKKKEQRESIQGKGLNSLNISISRLNLYRTYTVDL